MIFRWLKVQKARGGTLPPEAIQIGITPGEQPIYAVFQIRGENLYKGKLPDWANVPIVEE